MNNAGKFAGDLTMKEVILSHEEMNRLNNMTKDEALRTIENNSHKVELVRDVDKPNGAFIVLKKGYSFRKDICGQGWRDCENMMMASISIIAFELERAQQCDCAACLDRHNGKCVCHS